MSAREIISQVLDSAYGPEHAQDIINDLTAAGYRILGPDELDPVSIEKAAQLAELFCWERYRKGGKLKSPAVFNSHTKDAIGEAIRDLPTGGDR